MPIYYTVKYKTPDSFFWTTIPFVRADGIMIQETQVPVRYFLTSTEERIEVPLEHTLFYFSRERFLCIKEKMEQEAGFEIKIRS